MFADLGGHPEVQITAEPVIYEDEDDDNNKQSHDILLLQLPAPTNIPPVALPDCTYGPKQ